jgi:hypothetical protein
MAAALPLDLMALDDERMDIFAFERKDTGIETMKYIMTLIRDSNILSNERMGPIRLFIYDEIKALIAGDPLCVDDDVKLANVSGMIAKDCVYIFFISNNIEKHYETIDKIYKTFGLDNVFGYFIERTFHRSIDTSVLEKYRLFIV